MFCDCSDIEGGMDKSKKKDKHKIKKKKPEKMPKLSLLHLEKNGEIVECQLETSKNHTVNFMFNREEDKADEIADNLVSNILFC